MENTKYIQVHDIVSVPEPDITDIHQHEFIGIVVSVREDIVTVLDGSGDFFDIELHRLKRI